VAEATSSAAEEQAARFSSLLQEQAEVLQTTLEAAWGSMVGAANSRLQRLQGGFDTAAAAADRLQSRLDNARQAVALAAADKARQAEQRFAAVQQEVAKVPARFQETWDSLVGAANAKLQDVQARLDNARDTFAGVQQQLEDARTQVTRLALQQVTLAKSRVGELQKRIDTVRNRFDETWMGMVEQADARLKALQGKLDAGKKLLDGAAGSLKAAQEAR